ncbi:hypothetical protein KC343_g16933 [Hortaea werneckii]|uniref:Uncharacterized protein n=1 Tax=Hortaea werneckii TaxID=91943 RepID=A0A3M7BNC5_HORWE|nr:hypothetical protein KC352_g30294 [Hortaea werneckii]KAI7541981.1 hypothetical protein KC317_g16732 [Hortaea werneckii]KAI7585482.1 hypothetical protein KC346_g17693 [Hortaea werneckii]KAI7597011.1 hypothetical protein KC343_g16933 [Hortaea werneckii]KAI7642179.1 hypothetical protein KC319_g13162 [Hortaea werneckii]
MTDMSGGSQVSAVIDSASPVTHGSDNHKSFPFFDLPPELRNMIYSFSVKDTQVFRRYGLFAFKLVDYFQPSLQRVSKQFRHEYEKEVLKSAAICSLIWAFHNLDHWQSFPSLQELETLHLRIDYRHYRDPGFYMIHRKLRKYVRVLPSVKIINLRIDLLVDPYDYLIDEEYVTIENLFRLPPVDGGRVKVQFGLYLHSRLFKVLNSSQDGNGEADRISRDTPMVIFRASPSAGSYTYKGLHLEVESVGIFDESLDLCGLGVEDEEDRENSLYRL